MSGFQNKAPDIKLLNFMQIKTIVLISKNVIFNRSSFVNFETLVGFVASKRV